MKILILCIFILILCSFSDGKKDAITAYSNASATIVALVGVDRLTDSTFKINASEYQFHETDILDSIQVECNWKIVPSHLIAFE